MDILSFPDHPHVFPQGSFPNHPQVFCQAHSQTILKGSFTDHLKCFPCANSQTTHACFPQAHSHKCFPQAHSQTNPLVFPPGSFADQSSCVFPRLIRRPILLCYPQAHSQTNPLVFSPSSFADQSSCVFPGSFPDHPQRSPSRPPPPPPPGSFPDHSEQWLALWPEIINVFLVMVGVEWEGGMSLTLHPHSLNLQASHPPK